MDYSRSRAIATIRIIGGKFRGRKLNTPDVQQLRPTTDRIRETLFNWLMLDIVDAYCLDLFAGTGALGVEALSRGAKAVTFVEQNTKLCQQLHEHLQLLDCQRQAQVIQKDSIKWLQNTTHKKPFDIIFLDPPYSFDYLALLDTLSKSTCINSDTLVYIEQGKGLLGDQLGDQWQIIKQQKSGQVYYYLCKQGEGLWKSS